jgi:DNA-binding LytR/AlgR family response regulator
MDKVKVFVVEDESIVSKDIQYSLKRLGYDVVGSASSGENSLTKIAECAPDIVLMDIMLKGDLNGIETAAIIKSDFKIPVIFLTAYADDATLEKAKITEPYGYIIKPFKEIDLHTAIEMAVYKRGREKDAEKEMEMLYSLVENKHQSDHIFVKSKSQLVKIKLNDIYYIEALKDYVNIHLKDKRYTIYSTMKDMVVKLGETDFIRVHRSYIIRLDKVAAIDHSTIILEEQHMQIPIGGSYKEELLNRIHLF